MVGGEPWWVCAVPCESEARASLAPLPLEGPIGMPLALALGADPGGAADASHDEAMWSSDLDRRTMGTLADGGTMGTGEWTQWPL